MPGGVSDVDISGVLTSGLTIGRRTSAESGARVALIRPPIVIFPRSLSSYGPVPPVGLAYIAAVLRDAGHDVVVVDASAEGIDQAEDFESPVGQLRRVGLSPSEIVGRLPADVQMVGITHMFLHEWPQVREVATAVRERFPDATIVLGGENATAFHERILSECPAVDACVLGEGEATSLAIADRVADGLGLGGLEGVALRGSDDDVPATLSTRLRKLDAVPRPAWDLFPLDRYWEYSDFFGVHRGRSIPVLGTRGCPYRCSFCSSPQMWTTRYVVRDPEDVADEIAGYVRDYGIENVNFCDLTAVTKRSWTLRFCDALEARVENLDWQLPVGTRSEVLDEEVLQRLYDTGCRNITYAPESGSDRMLDIYDKRVDLQSMLDSLATAHRVGLRTRINVIIGHPAERWSDVWKSAKFLVRAARAGCDDASIIMFCPYPGSVDYSSLVDSGRLVVDEASYYVGISRTSSAHESYNDRMSSGALRAAQLAMEALFYGLGLVLHPKRVVEYIQAQRTGQERTFLDQLVRIKWRGFRSSGRQVAPGRRPRLRSDAAVAVSGAESVGSSFEQEVEPVALTRGVSSTG
jgi:anaerobic magnesium-protoporphyrin IX monomethyl ester cyclase